MATSAVRRAMARGRAGRPAGGTGRAPTAALMAQATGTIAQLARNFGAGGRANVSRAVQASYRQGLAAGATADQARAFRAAARASGITVMTEAE